MATLLVITVLLPLAGSLVLFLSPRMEVKAARWTALGVALATLALTLFLLLVFEAGVTAEVIGLAERYRLWEPARLQRNALAFTHGYREFLELAHARTPVRFRYLERELARIKTEIQEHTREYARRQMSWLKKMPPVVAVAGVEEAVAVVRRLIG